MIRFSNRFPKRSYLVGLVRIYRALYLYCDHIILSLRKGKSDFAFFALDGHSNKLDSFRNKHIKDKILIVANGPSLAHVDWNKYSDYKIMICNGFYKRAKELDIAYDYYFIEDVEQSEIRSRELNRLTGVIKLCSISNAHVLYKGWTYFKVPYRRNMINYFDEDLYPQFSRDFASVVHLGSSIIYIMLQFAYHVGSRHVEIVGLDHDYGLLPKLFPPGKLTITRENYNLVKSCHYDPNYYKIGDVIGVPFVQRQDEAFSYANEIFSKSNRVIINATPDSKCNAFKCLD